ncbi:MAG: T9SS type A sorting domain-containing protein [Syntrophomonadaceae bacterium]
MNKLKKLAAILCSLAFLTGWGGTGHNKINYNTVIFFPKEISQFTSWNTVLAQHASDADTRKNSDPTESNKHFLDIDSYSEFNSTGRIPENYQTIVSTYGASFVSKEGILPWATTAAVDSLKSAFQRKDWTKAQLFAADLGHYVADGHMPLHITKDYNGRTTADNGIHSRYESQMIDRFQQQITFSSDSVSYVSDVSRFVFDYIYGNYKFVDSVYHADSLARSKGSTGSTAYYNELWSSSSAMTVRLFNNASKRLAALIYTAWVNAGKPQLSSTRVEAKSKSPADFELMQNYPNPFNPETVIRYRLSRPGHVRLSLFNVLGKEVATLLDAEKPAGEFSLKVNANSLNIESGIYFYRMQGPGLLSQVRKMNVLK